MSGTHLPTQSPLMPAALMMGHHFSIPASRKPSGRNYFCRGPNPLRLAQRPGRGAFIGKAQVMTQRLIRYRVKAEKAEENQRLVEGVFRELHAKAPPQARYLVLRLS